MSAKMQAMVDDSGSRTPFKPDQQLRLADETLWRNLDGEAVLMQLASGSYFGVNEVGAEALAIIAEGATFATLLAGLLERFDVEEATLRGDLTELLVDMAARGLVELG